MNKYLLGLVSLIYLAVGINYLLSRQYGLCIAFWSYAVANLGLYLAGGV